VKPLRCQRTTVSGPDDAQGIKNARVTTIKPDKQDAVDPTQMQSTARRALLQDVELMPQYQDFDFQPQSRLEEVAQHAGKQEADRNHSAIMFGFVGDCEVKSMEFSEATRGFNLALGPVTPEAPVE
jgi:hypothetical protein